MAVQGVAVHLQLRARFSARAFARFLAARASARATLRFFSQWAHLQPIGFR